MLTDDKVDLISLDQIKVQKNNVRIHDIDVGTDDLAINIKANGLLQPVAAYFDAKKDIYVLLTGQRRLNAYDILNKQYPGEGFDKIKCIVIDEPKSEEKKLSLSLAENITQLPMTNSDLIKAVTDLYNVYGDYDMVQEEFGISKKMITTYVRLARLPQSIKDAINEGAISPNPKTAETAALKAVDATNYTKNGSIPVETVLELAKEIATGDITARELITEAKKGGTVAEIKSRAAKKPKEKINITLSTATAEKLRKVAESIGETEQLRATQYVVDGLEKDYAQLE